MIHSPLLKNTREIWCFIFPGQWFPSRDDPLPVAVFHTAFCEKLKSYIIALLEGLRKSRIDQLRGRRKDGCCFLIKSGSTIYGLIHGFRIHTCNVVVRGLNPKSGLKDLSGFRFTDHYYSLLEYQLDVNIPPFHCFAVFLPILSMESPLVPKPHKAIIGIFHCRCSIV